MYQSVDSHLIECVCEMAEIIDFVTAEILPNLPDSYRPHDGDPLPEGLAGATIVRVGTLPQPHAVEGGGLVIDYRPPQSKTTRRVVFAFNELGLWVHSLSDL
jgi:hypothetical protein